MPARIPPMESGKAHKGMGSEEHTPEDQNKLPGALFGEPQEVTQEIDFRAIGAYLCGRALTPEQEAGLAVFNMEYDAATEGKRLQRGY